MLPHGYTLAELDRVARTAAHKSSWRSMSLAERIDVARFAIVEYLYTCPDPGDFWEVVTVGTRAIWRHVQHELHHDGVQWTSDGIQPVRRFATYWQTPSMSTRSPEDGVVEALAVHQIMPQLTPAHRKAIEALAEHGDKDVAAQSMNYTLAGYQATLSLARSRFLGSWHQGEKPSQVWGKTMRRRADAQETIQRRRYRSRARQRQAIETTTLDNASGPPAPS